jgi:hypothetical protein
MKHDLGAERQAISDVATRLLREEGRFSGRCGEDNDLGAQTTTDTVD